MAKKNCRKFAKSGILPIFDFFGQKLIKSYSIWILIPDIEFSHYLASIMTHLLLFSHFKTFGLDVIIVSKNAGGGPKM